MSTFCLPMTFDQWKGQLLISYAYKAKANFAQVKKMNEKALREKLIV